MAQDTLDELRRLHGTSGEADMAGGEPSSMASVGGGVLDRPKTKQKHQRELQDFTNTLEYRNGDGELIGVAFPTVAPWPVVRSSRIRSSSALFNEQRA